MPMDTNSYSFSDTGTGYSFRVKLLKSHLLLVLKCRNSKRIISISPCSTCLDRWALVSDASLRGKIFMIWIIWWIFFPNRVGTARCGSIITRTLRWVRVTSLALALALLSDYFPFPISVPGNIIWPISLALNAWLNPMYFLFLLSGLPY